MWNTKGSQGISPKECLGERITHEILCINSFKVTGVGVAVRTLMANRKQGCVWLGCDCSRKPSWGPIGKLTTDVRSEFNSDVVIKTKKVRKEWPNVSHMLFKI